MHFIWIQWGAGEKRTAGFEMVLLRILSVASAFVVAGGPGNGNDVAAVWKRGAKIAAGLPKIEHMCYTLESNSTFTVRGRPAAGGESCEAGFYFHDRKLGSLESERKDQIDGTKYNL